MDRRTLIRQASVGIDSSAAHADVLVEGQIFTSIAPSISVLEADEIIEADSLFMLPGFIDIHTHGAVNVDFNHADDTQVQQVARFFASCGVTTFFPTVLTDTVETMKQQLELLSNPDVRSACPQIGGIHLEGPFLNHQYKGAMPEHLLLDCDVDLLRTLQKSARNTIRIMTIAPELKGAVDVIRAAVADGIVVSLGHTAAGYQQAIDAIDAGASGATHVMNAMKLMHMHDPAVLTAVLESDIYAEMICDGIHLHPPIVRFLLKAKGIERMIAVSDSIMATGCPNGIYKLGKSDIIVEHGDAKVISTGLRAGSTLTMDRALRNVIDFTRLPVERVYPVMSTNAARMLNIADRTGKIAIGTNADFVLLDHSLHVRRTVKSGQTIYSGETR